MVPYILLFSVVNIAIGFAVAVYLGRRPQEGPSTMDLDAARAPSRAASEPSRGPSATHHDEPHPTPEAVGTMTESASEAPPQGTGAEAETPAAGETHSTEAAPIAKAEDPAQPSTEDPSVTTAETGAENASISAEDAKAAEAWAENAKSQFQDLPAPSTSSAADAGPGSPERASTTQPDEAANPEEDVMRSDGAATAETVAVASEGPSLQGRTSKPSEADLMRSIVALEAPEAPLTGLRAEVDHYHYELTKADDALRAVGESPDTEAVRACLQFLEAATQEYLRQWTISHGAFEEAYCADEYAAARKRLHAAVRQQDQQIEATTAAVKSFDYQHDLPAGCRNMLEQTTRLLEANDYLRDTLDNTAIELAGENGTPVAASPDALTGATSRAGVEELLDGWWQEAAPLMRPLGVALVDVDGMGRINQQHGHRLGSEILRAIAQVLRGECASSVTVARYSGQQFLLLFPDADVRTAVDTVERIRQIVELARFYRGETEIRVTVSAAAVEAAPGDSVEDLIERAETTLHEAKRYGRSRTFLHEGKFPAPVVPPTLSPEPRRIEL